ncbi:carbohydrate ABC transporter substrate-binding protein [Pseudoalteromonas sp. MMG010]|uniref:ABC transporter substrate-binding protein n=1 Tax=Pseudoalteromonas sp. MMG010 TaxID=2822685 RepID=UPI001B3A0828|nr:ABC transporter substrate-binding protein [Pseudoalteromonas sp. MMG010]MBQ4832184.1 carbohydrate ABC transporter substrate-binding protein [Pseudoalteromonas sp. MMG010]
MRKKLPILSAMLLSFMFTLNCIASEKLDVAILVASANQRLLLTSLLNEFANTQPDIDISYTLYTDAEYKKAVSKWLEQGHGPDILNWQAGERLIHYVRSGKVQAIDKVWRTHNLDSQFSSNTKSAIMWQQHVYAIPVAYYYWGIYYRKSLFKKYNLQEPKTWREFVELSQVLKNNHITALTIGTRNHWPAAGWFDYLNLRINGLEFHHQLLNGEIAFTDSRVRDVFTYWKTLIDKGFFNEKPQLLMWDEAMYKLFRKQAAMTLMGTFLNGRIPEELQSDFGFFRFPIIKQDVGIYEDAPLDVFIVPYYTKLDNKIERFMNFLASANFQQTLNKSVGTLSANIHAKQGGSEILDISYVMHQQAAGTVNYFDRDARVDMAGKSIIVFADFLNNPDIELTLNKLEAIRKNRVNEPLKSNTH